MEDPTKYLIDISKQLGALDSAVDSIRQTQEEFKEEYIKGKEAAKNFQSEVRSTAQLFVMREEIKPLMMVNNIIKSWQGIMVILAIALAIGLLTWGEKAKTVLELKQGVLKGGKK